MKAAEAARSALVLKSQNLKHRANGIPRCFLTPCLCKCVSRASSWTPKSPRIDWNQKLSRLILNDPIQSILTLMHLGASGLIISKPWVES